MYRSPFQTVQRMWDNSFASTAVSHAVRTPLLRWQTGQERRNAVFNLKPGCEVLTYHCRGEQRASLELTDLPPISIGVYMVSQAIAGVFLS